MSTTAPYRIATDSKPEGKVKARTHGPISQRTLTTKVWAGIAPAPKVEDMHRYAALALAKKINPAARVELHSSGPYGNAFDWAVILPD